MNLQERLKQNEKDVEVLQAQGDRLKEQIKNEEFKVGDIVEFEFHHKSRRSRRVILFDGARGQLAAFDADGVAVGWGNLAGDYVKTGKNVFTDNMLSLEQ